MKGEILNLISSGEENNIVLAFEITKGQGLGDELNLWLKEKYSLFTDDLTVNGLVKLFNFTSLDLSDKGLTEIPESISELKKLECLDLDYNQITEKNKLKIKKVFGSKVILQPF